MKKKIAIVGAGFSGLAFAWHVSRQDLEVTLFDPLEGGTSYMSAGLLHPFTGIRGLNRFGREGMEATLKLLNVAAQESHLPIGQKTGILRLATTLEMEENFRKVALKYEKVRGLEPLECQKKVPGASPFFGLWIEEGWTIYPKRYLQALFKACEKKGVTLQKIKISSLQELSSFDEVVLTVGGHFDGFPELNSLSLRRHKGQLLEILWPENRPQYPFPIASQKYVTFDPDRPCAIIGSSFERNFMNLDPDLKTAQEEILPKAFEILPFLKEMSVFSCQAGLRATTPNHLPFAGYVREGLWALIGLGSKGLLYHALFAERLAQKLFSKIDMGFCSE